MTFHLCLLPASMHVHARVHTHHAHTCTQQFSQFSQRYLQIFTRQSRNAVISLAQLLSLLTEMLCKSLFINRSDNIMDYSIFKGYFGDRCVLSS